MSLNALFGNQALAVDPRKSVWLSASAGTGKTQVLSARVLRLLLQPDISPSQLLCLTFTRAGAAEMAERVNQVLASWVRMPATALAKDLIAIGADFDAATQHRARTLFASVLDCPGGGLRIDTIHAFSQWLLATFPEEAGLAPGTRAMEDRDRDLLAREVLAELLVVAERHNDLATLDALAALSLRFGADGAQSWLMRCASAHHLWIGPGAWAPPFRDRLNRTLGLNALEDGSGLAALCADHAFDVASVEVCRDAQSTWGTKTGQETASAMGAWLSLPPEERVDHIDEFARCFLKADGEPRSVKNVEKHQPDYESYAARVIACLAQVREMRALVSLAEWLEPALMLGRSFALAWDTAKTREGLIDFDDQIRRAADLLGRSDLSAWIRYKLDRRIDHVLIDEAQDTNEAQWDIIFALIDEYFAGEGARDDKIRTVFTVGDYKQAIFRFQGTSPENFEIARKRLKRAMADAAANAYDLRANTPAQELEELGLDRSWRTGQPVLDFVNAAMDQIGSARFGLSQPAEPHVGKARPGLVGLWPVVGADSPSADDDGNPDEQGDEGQEGAQNWFSRNDRRLADRIARQIRAWLDEGFPIAKEAKKGEPPRRAGPGDVMVLVRKRKELAGLIVARLYAAGVPVAGMDRLRLGAPLAVRDLLAALRFAAQPFDDLNLANLLVSPLIAWDQQQLLDYAYRPPGQALWSHLRASLDPHVRMTVGKLADLLALADFEPPQALLHWILMGPWQGRRNILARLGHEANDPIDELLNAAFAYAASHVPSLHGFLHWFGAGDAELKREADGAGGLVRVMTVHGSKGLQRPIVILADAADDPKASRTRDLFLPEPMADLPAGTVHQLQVPMPDLPADQRAGPLAAAHAKAEAEEMEEHWRLLYVAMTRAEEALFIAGSLGRRETAPAPDSWYGQIAPLFDGSDLPDAIWDTRREWGRLAELPMQSRPDAAHEPSRPDLVGLPDWALSPAGPEPRPPRPLAPSAAGQDDSGDPPLLREAGQDAARRGTMIHRLLERLPELPATRRAEAGARWLARQNGGFDDEARHEMLQAALRVLDTPEWADLFGPDALAEVPLAAVVDGQVIAGTVDRLVVRSDILRVVDFKTARRPPASIADVPLGTLRQMAAYVAALGAIYPGRPVEAAVLYTHGPNLIMLPDEMLAAHKPQIAL